MFNAFSCFFGLLNSFISQLNEIAGFGLPQSVIHSSFTFFMVA
jgi:hypothetical protein